MKVTVERLTGWNLALNLARATQGKEATENEPSLDWRRRILLARHSPIRVVFYQVTMKDIPYWVSVHFVRHKVGVEHFVGSQRTDITGIPREKKPQDSLVNHVMILNAEALMTVVQKRLCEKASLETREVAGIIASVTTAQEPYYKDILRRPCVLTGRCFEMKPCGFR